MRLRQRTILLLLAAGLAGAGPVRAPGQPADREGSPELVPPAIRNVTPPGILPGPTVEGPMERVPLPPEPPEPPGWRRFFLPRTTDSATFVTEDRVIRIFGVSPPTRDATCTTPAGEWACGRAALHAFRMFLRGRAVECLLPPEVDADQVVAPCRVGETDLGLWLLEHGWATPSDLAGEAYSDAAAAARCAQRGIWRGATVPETCAPRPS